jgi:S1-C subfamily serine protease
MTLTQYSDQLADAAAAAAASVVQVQGRRRPASGLVFEAGAVLTTAAALGGEQSASVRAPDGSRLDAEFAGWDPATHLVVLRVAGLQTPAATPAASTARVGQIGFAIGRSWSNAVTASFGNIAVIGGPLPTGRGVAIDQVIRTTAPMHRGFAGGAFVNVAAEVVGVATAHSIRGLGVIIPASIAWKAAREVLTHGGPRRAFLGIAGQAVRLPEAQREAGLPAGAVLVVHVTPGSPAAHAGLLLGDVITRLADTPVDSPDALLAALGSDRIGRPVSVGLLRGGQALELSVTVGERPWR